MSLFRRHTPSVAKDPVERDSTPVSIVKEDRENLRTELEKLKIKTAKKWYETRRFLFPLGISLGIILALSFVEPSDIHQMQAQLSLLMEEYDIRLPQIPDVNFTALDIEWQRIRSNIPEVWKFNRDGREFMVGDDMKARGLSAEHPVVLIPGVISTGLESWSTSPDYRPFFRQKMWGGFSMISQVTFNREKWMSAMMLDPITGLDPPDAKVRAAEGIDAASNFIQGYWIWSKIVENLAVLNYDTNNLHLAPYDWRLSYWNLEERDGYFSRLKTTIEGFKRRQKKKSVLVAHSMGATVVLYFFKWVESPKHGGGGPNWVEDHIEAYISVGGTHLGVSKAMAAFLSGEMKDTVQMNPAGAYALERFFSRKQRQQLFRSWAGSASMIIKGGEAVWGNATHAPDDTDDMTYSHGELIAFRNKQKPPVNDSGSRSNTMAALEQGNMTANDATLWMLEHTPSTFQRMVATNYSFGFEKDEKQLKKNAADHTKWTNPLEVTLPLAPSMKIYCVYGHGKETERSYWYARQPNEYDDDLADVVDPMCVDPMAEGCQTPRPPLDMPMSRTSWIDSDYTDEAARPITRNGVKMGEGDGTVSLLSLGVMCVEGWQRKKWNPAGVKVTTIELPHRPAPGQIRGGANTSDHVDILGSTGLNEIILKVATGVGSEVTENIVSDIRKYAGRINWD